jgi:hypothetical protein
MRRINDYLKTLPALWVAYLFLCAGGHIIAVAWLAKKCSDSIEDSQTSGALYLVWLVLCLFFIYKFWQAALWEQLPKPGAVDYNQGEAWKGPVTKMDDTSVLHDMMTQQIAKDLSRISEQVWAQYGGKTELTQDEFKVKSDQMLHRMATNGAVDAYEAAVKASADEMLTASNWAAALANIGESHGPTVILTPEYMIITTRRQDDQPSPESKTP